MMADVTPTASVPVRHHEMASPPVVRDRSTDWSCNRRLGYCAPDGRMVESERARAE